MGGGCVVLLFLSALHELPMNVKLLCAAMADTTMVSRGGGAAEGWPLSGPPRLGRTLSGQVWIFSTKQGNAPAGQCPGYLQASARRSI